LRLYLAFILSFLTFTLINVAFLDNLREIWGISYPLVLLVINLDLLVLFAVFVIFFRKFIKTYLTGRKGPLRRKLSTSLLLYIITPLIFLNVATAIILLQSTKSFISGQLKEVARKSERLNFMIEEEEKRRVEGYREVFRLLKENGMKPEAFKSFEDVVEVEKDPKCRETISEKAYTLCFDGYRLLIAREAGINSLMRDIAQTATELRNMVKARDIIGGVYVYFIVLAGFVSFLSAVWFGNLVARHVSLPLEKLSQRAGEIARGNFEVKVDVPQTGDEVQELAKSFVSMKEELKGLYDRLSKEREVLLTLFNALPVGIAFLSREGEQFYNRTYEELSKKANIRQSVIELEIGKVIVYEDLEAVILAERFKTWQMAVKRIAHEIKNPLTPISLNLERLLRSLQRGQCDMERIAQMAELMLEEIQRIKETIDQFRSLSTDTEPQFGEVDMGATLRQMAGLYEGLEIEVMGELKLVGDERLLRDMFFNLFNNSLEWGAKRVLVGLGKDTITYRDDGVGIEEGKEELIFMPYHSENPKGMGLGLAIVRHIAELHGWRVRAVPDKKGFYAVFELSSRNGSI
jgi:two-component system nitrogen regulation sensor histidine kinase NtrY